MSLLTQYEILNLNLMLKYWICHYSCPEKYCTLRSVNDKPAHETCSLQMPIIVSSKLRFLHFCAICAIILEKAS